MKKVALICLIVFIYSCNDLSNKTDTEVLEPQPIQTLDFKKNTFSDRAEELVYIREYLKYKLPKIFVKMHPSEMKKIQYTLIVNGEDVTLEEAARRSIMFSNQYQMLMSRYLSQNSNFKTIKSELENYDKYKKDWDAKLRAKKIDDLISTFKSYTINYIKQSSTLLNNNSYYGFTVEDYFETHYANKSIDYQKLRTDNPNIFRIIVEVTDNEIPFQLEIFEYNYINNYFSHIESFDQERLLNSD